MTRDSTSPPASPERTEPMAEAQDDGYASEESEDLDAAELDAGAAEGDDDDELSADADVLAAEPVPEVPRFEPEAEAAASSERSILDSLPSQSEIDPLAMDPDAIKVVLRLKAHGHQAYLVGGCVRDLLLGHKPK